MRITVLIAAFIGAFIFSCNNDEMPETIIPSDEMGRILFDMNMAEEFVNTYVTRDTSKNKNIEINKEYQKIFLMHNITEKQFTTSYDFYKAHTELYKTMMDTLNARAQRKRSQLYQVHN